MIIYILLAFLIARMKGYSIKPILRDRSLYPLFVAEILYLMLQTSVFLGYYRFIPYAGTFKTLYLYTLIVPIVVHRLYKAGFLGSIMLTVGSFLNRFVMSQNGGKMPVYATLSKYTGYFDEKVLGTIDQVHILGTEQTKYKILTDFIDVGYSILSIGDILIHAFIFIVVYDTIKSYHSSKTNQTGKERETTLWNNLS
ncbi:DUF5317 family protein [Proteiniclasticum ruminis]|uniref:Uncharacterized protein n=1 Tax=Proteiniclasticum ruminis TaxID=398199 RepID=A0A1I5C0N3_9CLOT|nr:DUF5317 family protein [Proteiniclasticum ruminis]SFN80603.1 hypothetical protein SAMN04488695_105160 [Proteiniclasticum ruminis]